MGVVRASPHPPSPLSTAPLLLDPPLQGSEPHSRPLAREALTAGQGPSSGRGPGWEVEGTSEAPCSPPLRTRAHWAPASYAGCGAGPPAAGLGLACVRSEPAGVSLSPAPPVPDPPLPRFPKGQPGHPPGPPPLHPALRPLPVSALVWVSHEGGWPSEVDAERAASLPGAGPRSHVRGLVPHGDLRAGSGAWSRVGDHRPCSPSFMALTFILSSNQSAEKAMATHSGTLA